ncbi:hypothetical protein SAMN05216167_14711 [Spirosoma endophyticum]|uniref:Uncharacterized protein n=1 Tax=Spirosoma endophyticum TaxID=662367 RepID=A0A1I2HU42_9BACT|nr:hypothetical protein SAMN05216167_14711 [Spirosoma endophyticum]
MIKEGNINFTVVNTDLTDEDREQISAWIRERKAMKATKVKASKETSVKRSKTKV